MSILRILMLYYAAFILPTFRTIILQKVKKYVDGRSDPIGLICVVSFLRSSTPVLDKELTKWMNQELPTAASLVVSKGEEGRKTLSDYIAHHGPLDLQT